MKAKVENLYDQLVSFLGKSPSDPDFVRFLQEFPDKPEILIDRKTKRFYAFRKSGVALLVDKRQDQVKTLNFHLAVSSKKEEALMSPFLGQLPAGITQNDRLEMLEEKLTTQPKYRLIMKANRNAPEFYWESKSAQPLKVKFVFDRETEQMSLLSVHFAIDTLPPEPALPEADTLPYADTMSEVLFHAKKEAGRLKYNFIGGESFLLGLLTMAQTLPGNALTAVGISLQIARSEVDDIMGSGDKTETDSFSYTPRAKRILRLAVSEAMDLKSEFVQPEHLLLAIIEEGEGVANRVFERLGIDQSELRTHLIRLMEKHQQGQ